MAFNSSAIWRPFLSPSRRSGARSSSVSNRSVPAQELVLIRVTGESASALEWIKSFEFRYRGNLYDIVRTGQSGDTTFYYCINDVQEERLFAGLDGHVRRQMESTGGHPPAPPDLAAPASSEYLPVTGSLPPPPAVVGLLQPTHSFSPYRPSRTSLHPPEDGVSDRRRAHVCGAHIIHISVGGIMNGRAPLLRVCMLLSLLFPPAVYPRRNCRRRPTPWSTRSMKW